MSQDAGRGFYVDWNIDENTNMLFSFLNQSRCAIVGGKHEMANTIPALVQPELLIWARESAGLSIGQASNKTHFDAFDIEQWEVGHSSPSISQLRKLGEVYKRPIAVFYLSSVPQGFSAQREFRRLPSIVPGTESPELRFALRQAAYRRDAALSILADIEESPIIPSLQIHPASDPERSALEIRGLLGITWDEQIRWPSEFSALNSWKQAIENQGVLIFQASGISLDEMRGTCMPDFPLPVIVLNSSDAPHGRIFSLIHEFVHILMNKAGHQTSRMHGALSPEEQPLEIAANAIAAATLLPKAQFLPFAIGYSSAFVGNDSELRRIAQKVKVSPDCILRRLVTLGRTKAAVYTSKRQEWGSKLWYSRPTEGGPIPVSTKVLATSGRTFTALVLDAYDRRYISSRAAGDYLSTRPKYFEEIRSKLIDYPVAQA